MHILKIRTIDPVWLKLSSYLAIMFFVFMSDAMISDFVPGMLADRLGNTIAMGIVMSTSSVAGIVLDLLFAQLFRGFSVRKMILVAIAGGITFVGLLYGVIYFPIVMLMILSMVAWGIYYEFFGFANQQYIAEIAIPQQRSALWSVLEMMRSLAYALGPLLGAYLFALGEEYILGGAVIILSLALLMFAVTKIKDKPVELSVEKIDLKSEVGHWFALGHRIWPILVMSFMLIMMDATFWSIGTIINDDLAKLNPLGGWLMTLYMIPALLVGILIVRLKIHRRKKRFAQLFILAGSLCLSMFTIFDNVFWYLGVVFVASLLMALAWPLVDAVYTDLVVRMGRERHHLIGLCSSMNSLGYIVGPIIAGILAQTVGEYQTFQFLGIGMAAGTILLLVLTPKKLRLPQDAIEGWE